MKTRLLAFIDQLRTAGVRTSVSESLDAMAAVSALGVERAALHAGLAATLIKDEADRPTFEALFDRFFAVPGRVRGKGERPQPAGEGSSRGHGEPGAAGQRRDEPQPPGHGAPQNGVKERRHEERREISASQPAARRRALLDLPFDEMDARAVEEAEELLAELTRRMHAHLSRRYRYAATGRLDFRRTIRASLASGGVPLDPVFRARRPGRLDLIALCDVSYSTATAADFCLGLLAPAAAFFRHVHLFGYVDRLVEISVEHGHVVPHQPLDLAARSDFGRVLRELWERWEPLLTRNTLVIILGDARNNRRPPRADILSRVHTRARRIGWLNPEPRARWNTGDSVLQAYAKHCDELWAAANLRDLARALKSSL